MFNNVGLTPNGPVLTHSQARPIAFFDLDGTTCSTGFALNPHAQDVALLPGDRDRLSNLRSRGYLLVGITNQGGISKGVITDAEVRAANGRMQEILGTEAFDRIFYCGHYATRDGRACDCKKPAPGMILDALSALPGSSLAGAFVVGDNAAADGGAASMLALPYIDASNFRSRTTDDLLASVSRRDEPQGGLDHDKVLGTLLGLATADAFGAPVEFWPRERVKQAYPDGLGEMRASGIWALGEYTDDTDMTLMLADSLIERGHLDPIDLATRFRTWARNAKDVGLQIRRVTGMRGYAEHPEQSAREDYAGHPNGAAGNGAVMRCAPVALFHWADLSMLLADSRRSARVTHGDPKAQSSCVLINAAIAHLITGGDREEPWKHGLAFLTEEEKAAWTRLPGIARLTADDLSGKGYTVSSVESAFWSFVTTSSFEEAIEQAVALGDDTDTTAAITGALAGAWYGAAGIPDRWKSKLMHADRVEKAAAHLVRPRR